MSRLALAWCRAYTAAVPANARERRREEIESFVWESRDAGVGARRVALGAVKGAVDDLRWIQHERSRATLSPISATIGGSAAIAGVLMLVTFVLSLLDHEGIGAIAAWIPGAAVIVLVVAYVDRVRHRNKGS